MKRGNMPHLVNLKLREHATFDTTKNVVNATPNKPATTEHATSDKPENEGTCHLTKLKRREFATPDCN